jgi:hypothetical protein
LPRARPAQERNTAAARESTAAASMLRRAELHWYYASGIGGRELKIKRFID